MAKFGPIAPSMHLIEFYARHCDEREFDSLLVRRGLSPFERLQIKECYYRVRENLSGMELKKQEVLA